MKKQKNTKKNESIDIVSIISNMSDEQMRTILISISDSVDVWPAIIKYINQRLQLADDALRSLDPFKEPTQVARNQGIRIGLLDLPEAVNIEKENRRKAEDEEQES